MYSCAKICGKKNSARLDRKSLGHVVFRHLNDQSSNGSYGWRSHSLEVHAAAVLESVLKENINLDFRYPDKYRWDMD